MKYRRLSRAFKFMQQLLWSERAQLIETSRLYIILLVSISVMVTLFGIIYYVIQILQNSPRSIVDCFYFVWITFATIGYSDEGFTGSWFIQVVTILVGAYLITRFIVLSAHVYARVVVEEVYDIKVMKKMKKSVLRAEGHFLIFGDDRELINKIIQGLIGKREIYLVSDNRKLIESFAGKYRDLKYIREKPFSTETINLVQPEAAKGAYVLFVEDEKNLLLGAMLQHRVRVISSFSGNLQVLPRFRRIGVEPISPHFSGGLKIVSTMIRPKVTEFLDRFVFPDDGMLEFRLEKNFEHNGSAVELAAVSGGKIDFTASRCPERECLVLGFRNGNNGEKKLGAISTLDLPIRTDRFLVMGGGTIGQTVIAEILATGRELTVVEPDAWKIEQMKRQYGENAANWVVGESMPTDYNLDEYDGAAIVTPADEKNFAIGLDFVGAPLHRVVRALDDDMEQHYRRIGAVPVFIGWVGSERMLREVTNRFSNEVLSNMLLQSFRFDQVFLSKPARADEIRENFQVDVIALCREHTCWFGAHHGETFKAGDTLIVCGHVDNNKRLRLHHRVKELL